MWTVQVSPIVCVGLAPQSEVRWEQRGYCGTTRRQGCRQLCCWRLKQPSCDSYPRGGRGERGWGSSEFRPSISLPPSLGDQNAKNQERTCLVIQQPTGEVLHGAVAFPLDSPNNDFVVGGLHVERAVHAGLARLHPWPGRPQRRRDQRRRGLGLLYALVDGHRGHLDLGRPRGCISGNNGLCWLGHGMVFLSGTLGSVADWRPKGGRQLGTRRGSSKIWASTAGRRGVCVCVRRPRNTQ